MISIEGFKKEKKFPSINRGFFKTRYTAETNVAGKPSDPTLIISENVGGKK